MSRGNRHDEVARSLVGGSPETQEKDLEDERREIRKASRSVGLTYEGTPDDGWDNARHCSLHGGYEMFHTCAGGPGEPLGYCSAWDGEMVGGHVAGVIRYDGSPSCQWIEDAPLEDDTENHSKEHEQ